MFICKVCKGILKPAVPSSGSGVTSANSSSGFSRPPAASGDDSNGGGDFGDGGSEFGDEVSTKVGVGKGKPLAALAQSSGGKRRRFGIVGRPRGGGVPVVTNWKGQASNKPNESSTTSVAAPVSTITTASSSSTSAATTLASIAKEKRLGDVRRRGRQPKIRGMVGLQVCLLRFLFVLR